MRELLSVFTQLIVREADSIFLFFIFPKKVEYDILIQSVMKME